MYMRIWAVCSCIIWHICWKRTASLIGCFLLKDDVRSRFWMNMVECSVWANMVECSVWAFVLITMCTTTQFVQPFVMITINLDIVTSSPYLVKSAIAAKFLWPLPYALIFITISDEIVGDKFISLHKLSKYYILIDVSLKKKIIGIFHGCWVWIEKSIQGSLFGITSLC